MFLSCSSLSEIIIPKSVENLGKWVFSFCGNLKQITLYKGVKRIDDGAFNQCMGLTDVYFYGTEAQWNKIELGSNNEALNYATIHFMENDEEDTSTNPEDPTEPKNDNNESKNKNSLNFFQRIIQWFKNLFAKLFRKK